MYILHNIRSYGQSIVYNINNTVEQCYLQYHDEPSLYLAQYCHGVHYKM